MEFFEIIEMSPGATGFSDKRAAITDIDDRLKGVSVIDDCRGEIAPH
jgi:hypothetical protein